MRLKRGEGERTNTKIREGRRAGGCKKRQEGQGGGRNNKETERGEEDGG